MQPACFPHCFPSAGAAPWVGWRWLVMRISPSQAQLFLDLAEAFSQSKLLWSKSNPLKLAVTKGELTLRIYWCLRNSKGRTVSWPAKDQEMENCQQTGPLLSQAASVFSVSLLPSVSVPLTTWRNRVIHDIRVFLCSCQDRPGTSQSQSRSPA